MTVEPATRITAADPYAISAAARILAAGSLVAFPTETVYGLGTDATNGEAVARLYAAKGRPRFNPLIAHVPDADAAHALAVFDATADQLAATFWPGPLTLVLPKAMRCPVADLATAGLDTIAVRVPAHPIARDLLAAVGKPVVAPSANRSGHVSPTTAQHVAADLGDRVDFILDGGPTPLGLESTIIACLDSPMLLRPGALPRERIEAVLGRRLADPVSDKTIAPGMLASHYAPRARLRLNVDGLRTGEALLTFGPPLPTHAEKAVAILNLSRTGDLMEAAANLFSHLRRLDTESHTIAVMPIPKNGLGEAINDRLTRAAAPR